ncbi:benzoate-CoA ligase family protein [Streptomyces ipomoeae]|uniref:benzoate-CoA ligase family protein n=1 Tax=Streptomyces ipomoeae TaxID=103232 RepID=UPI0011461F17|nr:benzoate-CoA ligase family protein [Streptomyces ipomoeae]MDX2933871.1 benzoate-CoA ligase family protein [Streptomyces ipomoeae]TQE28865.1 benzoate-CoA ligase family protein [Streptomyces ipomoeae]
MTTTPHPTLLKAAASIPTQRGAKAPRPADANAPGNLAAHLAALAERRGWTDRPAFHQGHRAHTHGEIHALASRAATVLADHGVRPGDRVMLALPDSIAWVTAFLATARLGAVAVLVNPELTPPELQFMSEDTEAVLWVTGPGLDHHIPARGNRGREWGSDQPHTPGAASTPPRAERLGADQLMALSATAAPKTDAHPVDAHTPLYIQYTSGTTGRPKGVVHVHGDPKTYHDLIGRRLLRITQSDVTLSVSRLYFAYGFGNAFVFPLFSGSSAVLTDRRPTPAVVDELVARHRVTLLYSVPSAYAALIADRANGHEACFASVRAAVSAGEGMPAGLGKQVTELLGAPVLEQIGSTEAGHAFCANSFDHNHPGTVGRPVPGFEVELRDRAGNPVPDGETGELWVRGPTVTPGYLNRPEETGRAFAGGWLATRDRARREPDGTYRHLGRADDMEMVGGITVSPLEVEALLRTHPAVRDVAVVAVTDERGASKLRAFVIPVPPIAVGLEAELIRMARDKLAAFKVPRSVSFVPTLPRTATGKLRRHLVRQGAW